MLRIRNFRKFGAILLALVVCALGSGCGASNDKCVVQTTISPATATADHTLAAPGNQVQFTGVVKPSKNCASAAVVVTPHWMTSDPTNTSIDAVTGLATCLNATPSPATITLTESPLYMDFTPATLTCK